MLIVSIEMFGMVGIGSEMMAVTMIVAVLVVEVGWEGLISLPYWTFVAVVMISIEDSGVSLDAAFVVW